MKTKEELYMSTWSSNNRIRNALKRSALCADLKRKEIDRILETLPYTICTYKKGEVIIAQDDELTKIGVLLKGGVKRFIEFIGMDEDEGEDENPATSHYALRDVIGIAIATSRTKRSPYIFSAEMNSTILWIEWDLIAQSGTSDIPESFRLALFKNTSRIMDGALKHMVKLADKLAREESLAERNQPRA
jgi:hypothetical protein